MLLAAGRGERMRPLTDGLPKPMLQAAGQPLLHYPLRALADAGVVRVVINLAWQGKKIRAWLGNGQDYGLQVQYSDEGDQALETGGGIFRALPLLGEEPFWLVNGDVFCDYPFPPRSLAETDLAHLVMVSNPPHHPAGDFCLRQNRICADAGPRLTYSGLAILRPELFAGARAGVFPLAPLLTKALRENKVAGEQYHGEWTDVGTPRRLAELDQRLRRDSPVQRSR